MPGGRSGNWPMVAEHLGNGYGQALGAGASRSPGQALELGRSLGELGRSSSITLSTSASASTSASTQSSAPGLVNVLMGQWDRWAMEPWASGALAVAWIALHWLGLTWLGLVACLEWLALAPHDTAGATGLHGAFGPWRHLDPGHHVGTSKAHGGHMSTAWYKWNSRRS